MKLYLVTYDNGEEYEMNDQKQIVIFDSLDKAKLYAESYGFTEANEDEYGAGIFHREHSNRHEWLKFKDYIFIEEFEINTPKGEEYI